MLTVTLRATFKMAAAVGNAPTYQVLQTRANLSQLSSEISGREDSNLRSFLLPKQVPWPLGDCP